jgi:hypothetical protein
MRTNLVDKLVQLSYESATESELREAFEDQMYFFFSKMSELEQERMLEDLQDGR